MELKYLTTGVGIKNSIAEKSGSFGLESQEESPVFSNNREKQEI